MEQSVTYARGSEDIAVGTFAEVVAGSDLPVEIFAKEDFEFPLSIL